MAEWERVQMEIIATPSDVENGILAFAQKELTSCFGSLDLAAESGGEWWFLEINEQGKVISIMKSCGFSEDQMHRCHAEFELSP